MKEKIAFQLITVLAAKGVISIDDIKGPLEHGAWYERQKGNEAAAVEYETVVRELTDAFAYQNGQ